MIRFGGNAIRASDTFKQVGHTAKKFITRRKPDLPLAREIESKATESDSILDRSTGNKAVGCYAKIFSIDNNEIRLHPNILIRRASSNWNLQRSEERFQIIKLYMYAISFLGRNSVSTIELTKICDQNKYPVNSGDLKRSLLSNSRKHLFSLEMNQKKRTYVSLTNQGKQEAQSLADRLNSSNPENFQDVTSKSIQDSDKHFPIEAFPPVAKKFITRRKPDLPLAREIESKATESDSILDRSTGNKAVGCYAKIFSIDNNEIRLHPNILIRRASSNWNLQRSEERFQIIKLYMYAISFLGRNSVSTIELTKICDQNKYPVNSGDLKRSLLSNSRKHLFSLEMNQKKRTYVSLTNQGKQEAQSLADRLNSSNPENFQDVTSKSIQDPDKHLENHAPFPIEAFPPVAKKFIRELSEKVQVDKGIVGTQVLALMALVCQKSGDVFDGIQRVPLSLNVLISAESGERKTASQKEILKKVRDFEKERFSDYESRVREYIFKKKRWDKIVNEKSSKDKSDEELLFLEPRKPVNPKMTMQDPTIEGITKQFFTGKESLGLFTDEGAKVFGGHSMSKGKSLAAIGHLSNFWDGMPIERTRSGDKTSFMLHDKRLTVCIMTQPDIFFQVWNNSLFQTQGFLPRFLVINAKAKSGERVHVFTKESQKLHYAQEFHKRVDYLIRFPHKYEEIELSMHARKVKTEFQQTIENCLKPGGKYHMIAAYANKSTEQATRIAANISIFGKNNKACKRKSTVISLAEFNQGKSLAQWYLNEALRLFYKKKQCL